MSPECPPPGRVTLSEVPETSEQALVLALYLGLAAPDDDKAQAAGILAEESAVGHRRVDRRALQSRRARAVRGRGAVAHRPPGVNRQTGRPGQAERGRVAAPSNPSRERGTGSSTAAASSPQAYSTACLPARDPATGRAGRASASVTTSNPATPERGWGSPLTTRDSRRVCHAPEYPGRFLSLLVFWLRQFPQPLNHRIGASAEARARQLTALAIDRSCVDRTSVDIKPHPCHRCGHGRTSSVPGRLIRDAGEGCGHPGYTAADPSGEQGRRAG